MYHLHVASAEHACSHAACATLLPSHLMRVLEPKHLRPPAVVWSTQSYCGVGAAVGAEVGAADGATDGIAVGAGVGGAIGAPVGGAEGIAVGATVSGAPISFSFIELPD